MTQEKKLGAVVWYGATE